MVWTTRGRRLAAVLDRIAADHLSPRRPGGDRPGGVGTPCHALVLGTCVEVSAAYQAVALGAGGTLTSLELVASAVVGKIGLLALR